MRKPRLPIGVERILLEALDAKAGLGITASELKVITGITGASFKDGVVRLSRKAFILQWRVSARLNLLVSAKFTHTAHYLEQVKINPLYAAFGHASDTITVQRSIPFVLLTDDGTRKKNRYREMDEKVA